MNDGVETSWENMGLAAALAKTYAADQRDFLPIVAGLLEDALPQDQINVIRKPIRLFSSEKKIVSVELIFGDDTYVLQVGGDGHRLEATHRKMVRGITLKTESQQVQDWLTMVGQHIQTLAAQNERVYTSLQNFLELKNL
jgi:hypothetical protein